MSMKHFVFGNISESCVVSLTEILAHNHTINVNDEIKIDGIEATPLWFAVTCEEIDIAEILLATGASPNIPCSSLLSTPLHIAAYKRNVDMVRLLLKFAADTDVLDKWNYSPLMYAASHCEPVVVKELFNAMISRGCDVNFGAVLNLNLKKQNIFHKNLHTYKYDKTRFVIFTKDPIGPTSGTALHIAVQNPHLPTECIEILLEAGASLNKVNLNGQTPLMTVMLDMYYDYHNNVKNHAELLVEIIKRDTSGEKDIDMQDLRGWTCFHYAAQQGSISCMELLLTAGCDCNLPSFTGETPLWILLIHGWREGTKYLLTNGCDVNHLLNTSMILQMNQDVNICRHGVISAIEFAVSNKYYSVALLMLQLGCKAELRSIKSCCFSQNDNDQLKHFLRNAEDIFKSLSQVQSLSILCRRVIRQTMKQGIQYKCKTIGLPLTIQNFISFNE